MIWRGVKPQFFMKSYVIPTVSTESVGNSLFECFSFDMEKDQNTVERKFPVKVESGVVCVCLRGSGRFVINNQAYEISPGSLITILPNSLICEASSSDDFLGFAVATARNVMSSFQMGDVVKGFVYISNHPVLKIDEQQTATIVELCEMLTRKRKTKECPFKEETIHHLLAVLCYEIYGYYMEQMHVTRTPEPQSRQSVMCQEFLRLVDMYATEYREMEFYADKLCITPKYLSVVVKKVSGHSPAEWIDNMVMLYARTLLSTSEMTVQQIAAELNFPNPSFFGQYFKRHEGITPKKFRTKTRG